MTKEQLNDNILDSSVEVDNRLYAGRLTRQYKDAPLVTDGAMLLAYEVIEGIYGNAPERKDNIYRAVMECVNYLIHKEE